MASRKHNNTLVMNSGENRDKTINSLNKRRQCIKLGQLVSSVGANLFLDGQGQKNTKAGTRIGTPINKVGLFKFSSFKIHHPT